MSPRKGNTGKGSAPSGKKLTAVNARAAPRPKTRRPAKKAVLPPAASGGPVIADLDPHRVSSSFIEDRFDGDDPEFESLCQSIRDRGQETPILVRPHPGMAGRYEVAYGHRRVRAAKALSRQVRAIVREMSDAELVVAQGVENAQRKDLSFIERAMFAFKLEQRGFERAVIQDALAIDKTELSRLIATANVIPDLILMAVGAAPKIGRPRWLALAKALNDPAARQVALTLAKTLAMAQKRCEANFAKIFEAATRRPAASKTSAWTSTDGRAKATISRSARATSIVLGDDDKGFSDFVVARLDALHAEFAKTRKG